MGSFTTQKEQFILNGEPFRIISGAMHYFRVLPELWEDRLLKMRAMGVNTLETYVAWNLHEPQPGQFNFDGILDLVSYVKLAEKLGFKVIVRPGPYICAEWEFGGLPAWLLKDDNMRLRCAYPPYLEAVSRFFEALLPQLVPLLITNGGPIIAVQIENEYGSYGNDKDYLRFLENKLRSSGIDTLLFTSDGPTDDMLQNGTLPHILKTVNFGSKPESAFALLRRYQPEGPIMCTEFWDGWFDHWGEEHHTRSAEDAAQTLDWMLAAGASVNFYMFHGGTNFGFMNGANASPAPTYEPTIGSYDYDSPLSEAGDPTPKYYAFREIIAKYAPLPNMAIPNPSVKIALPPVELRESVGLFEALGSLSEPVQSATPEPMEKFGQNYGFILYRTQISGPRAENELSIRGLHDRAQVFANGKAIGVLEREVPGQSLKLTVPAEGVTLDILVENMGRVNYGPDLADRKGITDSVLLGHHGLFGWTVFPLPLENLAGLTFTEARTKDGPRFYRSSFEVTQTGDTFLALPGWTKGVAWINGFNLGRFWSRGPQVTLYVPAPLLRQGSNELIVLELHGTDTAIAEFRDAPQLG